MDSKEIDFKRVKIIFVLIWRKFLSSVLHWAKRHSKSYCIHVVLILYKTGFLIVTHKHVCNIIISGIYRSSFLSSHNLLRIVYIYAHNHISITTRVKGHAEMGFASWRGWNMPNILCQIRFITINQSYDWTFFHGFWFSRCCRGTELFRTIRIRENKWKWIRRFGNRIREI